MINNILLYLLLGLLWIVFLDIASHLLKTESKLNNIEKLIVSLFWPITIIIFAYHFIRAFK